MSFFFNDTATTEIYTLSLHDALPILRAVDMQPRTRPLLQIGVPIARIGQLQRRLIEQRLVQRSEEHTSELQSLAYLVCRLLLKKKKPSMPPPVMMPFVTTTSPSNPRP